MELLSKQIDGAAYALVRVRGERGSFRASLPLLVGSSGLCDIVVNAQSLPPLAYTIFVEDGQLAVLKHSTSTPVSLATLSKLGIEVLGPISGEPDQKKTPLLAARELLAKEAKIFGGLPRLGRSILLGSLPQPLRLSAWSLAAVATCALTLMPANASPDLIDLSKTPIPLAFDVIRSDMLGANPTKADFVRGYERGVTLAVDAPADVEGEAALLSFSVAGLNFGKELVVQVNGRQVFESDAESACAQKICEKTVRIEPSIMKAGANTISFIHGETQSSYFLSNLHVRRLPATTSVETEQAEHWFELATRAYAERDIMPENLVTAQGHVNAVLKLASERDGTEALSSKATVLQNDIKQAFAKVTEELWANAAIFERLQNKPELDRTLQLLLRLYPDASSEQHILIQEKILETKDVAS